MQLFIPVQMIIAKKLHCLDVFGYEIIHLRPVLKYLHRWNLWAWCRVMRTKVGKYWGADEHIVVFCPLSPRDESNNLTCCLKSKNEGTILIYNQIVLDIKNNQTSSNNKDQFYLVALIYSEKTPDLNVLMVKNSKFARFYDIEQSHISQMQ